MESAGVTYAHMYVSSLIQSFLRRIWSKVINFTVYFNAKLLSYINMVVGSGVAGEVMALPLLFIEFTQ